MVQLNQNFINSIAEQLPSHLSLDEFIEICGKPLRPSLRVNTLKITSADLLPRLQAQGWQFSPIPWCTEGFWFTAPPHVQAGNTIEHLQGLFYLQEASSMLPPVALLYDTPQTRVLDMASAPGSKTSQLAAMMENRGLLVANEYSASRIKALHANILRLGLTNVALTLFDARVFGETLYETFDAILLDAPCSGEGTVRKDPLALKDWDGSNIADIATTQKDLIESAFKALKPGGVLVYSTCTLNRHENQAVCHHLQQRFPQAVAFESLAQLFNGADQALTPEGFLHVWPQIFDSEGFFVARIRKTSTLACPPPEKSLQKNFPFQPLPNKLYQQLTALLQARLACELPQAQIWLRDNEIWLFPETFSELIGRLRFQRIGIKLADIEKHGIKLQHEAVLALYNSETPALTLDRPQAIDYLMGRDISLNGQDPATGEQVVQWQGSPLGMVKDLGNRLKNQLPRNLVRDNVQSSD